MLSIHLPSYISVHALSYSVIIINQPIHINLSAGTQNITGANVLIKEEQGKRNWIKGIVMAQWVNRLRNNIFVNPPPLPSSCEISGALHLAQPGLTAGRLADRRNTGKFRKFQNWL